MIKIKDLADFIQFIHYTDPIFLTTREKRLFPRRASDYVPFNHAVTKTCCHRQTQHGISSANDATVRHRRNSTDVLLEPSIHRGHIKSRKRT